MTPCTFDHDLFLRTSNQPQRVGSDKMFIEAPSTTTTHNDVVPLPTREPLTHMPHEIHSASSAMVDGTPSAPTVPTQCSAVQGPNLQISPEIRRWVHYVTTPNGLLDISNAYQCIAPQTNCLTCSGAGLACDIANAFPYGCPCTNRRMSSDFRNVACPDDRSTTGSITKLSCTTEAIDNEWRPTVVNMMAQWEPGTPLKLNRIPGPIGQIDDSITRLGWFRSGFSAIAADTTITNIAFPRNIGCGMAGGVSAQIRIGHHRSRQGQPSY